MLAAKDTWILRGCILGLWSGMAISWSLWLPIFRTSMPMVPVFEQTGALSGLQSFLSLVIILAGAFLLLKPAQKGAFFVLLGTLLLAFLLDQNTGQPWVWFYFLMLTGLLFARYDQDSASNFALPAIFVSVYFWGGVYKITPYFAEDNFPWFCGAYTWMEPLGKISALGYCIAVAEAFFAVGLLYAPTRQFTRVSVVHFHAAICLMLSPLGLNWNWVVIPWNLAMAGMVWVLFSDQTQFRLNKKPLMWALLAIAWIGPALNLVGAWPDSFSWKLYSNTQSEATFYNPAATAPCAPLGAIWDKKAFEEHQYLLLDDWSYDALKTPIHASSSVFFALGKKLCACDNVPDSAGLYILRVQPWNRAAERMDFYPCSLILKKGH